VFLFFMLVSTLNAIILQEIDNQLLAFFHFLKHIEYIVIFVLAFNIPDSLEDIRFLVFCLFGAATVLAVQSLFSPVGLVGALTEAATAAAEGTAEGGAGRLQGVATETANIFGGFLVFHSLMLASFLIEERSLNKQLIYFVAFTALFTPILFTLSRSSYVGIAAGLIFLGIFRDPRLLLFMGLIAIAVGSLVPTTVLQRFFSIFTAMANVELTPSWQARLNAWEHYLPTIIRNPFIGQGLFYISPGEVDNELVLRAIETGLLGVLSMVWVFWNFFKRALFILREGSEKLYRQLGLGYVAGIIGMFCHSLAATSFTTIRTAEPIYFVSGLVLAAYLLRLKITRQHDGVDIEKKHQEIIIERTKTYSRRMLDSQQV
ncbi:MAG: O-antigen ligase family protein, partial [bacterium]